MWCTTACGSATRLRGWAQPLILSPLTPPPAPSPPPPPPPPPPHTLQSPTIIPLSRLQYQFSERVLAAANTHLPCTSAADALFAAQLSAAVQRATRGSFGAPDAATGGDYGAALPKPPAASVQPV